MAATRTLPPAKAGPRAAAASDPGRQRENNEDRVLCLPELGIFAVIDGVGGESAGEVAAETALDVLRARLSRRTTDLGRLVQEAIAQANLQIYERARKDRRLSGMACVLTVAVVEGNEATVGHVGDSRLYALRPGEIRKVTADHSPVGTREDAGELSEAEAMRHPRRNEIFRDVGSAPHEPDETGWIDVLKIPFPADSALLLCSDGLSDMIDSQEILETVEENAGSPTPADAAVQALIDRANAAGGRDNVSAVLVLGDRYVEAVRRRRIAPAKKPAAAASSVRGAGHVRGGRARKVVLTLLFLALVLAALFLFREPILDALNLGGGGTPGPSRGVLVVGIGDGGVATLGEALAQARPGQRIEVAPGEYHERIALKDGVAIVSRTPRGAVLLPPLPPAAAAGETPAARAIPAVTANGVRGARLSGFRVVGTPAAPWSVGVRLTDSEVELDGLEVTGASGAGIEIRGADRSAVRDSYIHGNGGAGISLSGAAATRISGNLLHGNGTRPGALAPGIEVKEGALPLLANNRFEGNGAAGVLLPAPERVEEVYRWNSFGTLPRDVAVKVVAAPAPAPGKPAAGSAGTAGSAGSATSAASTAAAGGRR